jgi:deoxyribodipyrimidine photo-lyase
MTSTEKPWGLHWFRRDLRLSGNPALRANLKKHSGRVLGIFFFDAAFLARPDFSTIRFAFFLETLQALRTEMREHGGELLVVDIAPRTGFDSLLTWFRDSRLPLPATCSWNRDYEPFATQRDAEIETLLHGRWGIETLTERDHLLIEPHELLKGPVGKEKREVGSFYQVFTPFQNKWLALLASEDFQSRLAALKRSHRDKPRFELKWSQFSEQPGFLRFRDALDTYRTRLSRQNPIALPPAGEKAAQAALRKFGRHGLEKYGIERDIPSSEGTSRFSVYLKNGSLTVPQVIEELELGGFSKPLKRGTTSELSRFKFLSELVWREFYYHILAHVPRVETTPFQLKYSKLAWEGNPAHFEAWKSGLTGFPIVDAGMRQLRDTGWMHNRVRMIVASFLTKDLLINWQEGERYFMEMLLDGDLAPNNGGWQWAASTGCDPQPYFRIFNPTLQFERFDPTESYVRRWVPEYGSSRYPKPIVDHATQAQRAIKMFKTAIRDGAEPNRSPQH